MVRVARLSEFPWFLLSAAGLLVALGWLGIGRSEWLRLQVTGASGHYLRQQVIYSSFGLLLLCVVGSIDYRRWRRWAYVAYAVGLGLLVVVYFFPAIKGAHRWIRVGPVGFQPSEFVKLAFVVAMARYLMYRDNFRRLRGLLPPLVLAFVPLILILREPDLGMSLVFVPVLFAMLLVAGARATDLGVLLLLGLCLTPVVWSQMTGEQRSRIASLFDQPSPGQHVSDNAYHLYQAKRMLALGGTSGSWLAGEASDDATAYHLPEARTDFIFCVLGERLGLWGLGLLLVLYGVLVVCGARIAAQSRDPFGRLVATGVVAVMAVQVVINTAMTVGLLPITGLSLPMVSYGGSGLAAHAIGLGLLTSIATHPGYEMSDEPFRYLVDGA
ncbi:MAG: FtsW/RodA/SpoVE family cell cycle protein [Planctomycetota bacterium]